jgi:hypothetical protein
MEPRAAIQWGTLYVHVTMVKRKKKKLEPLESPRTVSLFEQVWLRSPYGGNLIGPYTVLGLDPILLARHYYSYGQGGVACSQWMTFFNVTESQVVLTGEPRFTFKGGQGGSYDWFCTEYVERELSYRTLFDLETPAATCPIKKQDCSSPAELRSVVH